jgi:hypothetical protein
LRRVARSQLLGEQRFHFLGSDRLPGFQCYLTPELSRAEKRRRLVWTVWRNFTTQQCATF